MKINHFVHQEMEINNGKHPLGNFDQVHWRTGAYSDCLVAVALVADILLVVNSASALGHRLTAEIFATFCRRIFASECSEKLVQFVKMRWTNANRYGN